jgi:hypothetical protein
MAKQLQRRQKTFCTECGSDLDEFWLSPGAANYEDILKHHLECQREGRFKGSMCSKLFIMDGGTPDASRNPEPTPSRKNSRLKKSIMKKISDEDSKTTPP